MLVLSTQHFGGNDVARLEAAGCTYRFVAPGGDPHGASSDQFLAGIYALPEEVRCEAVALVAPCFHVTARLLRLPNLRGHHPAGASTGRVLTQ